MKTDSNNPSDWLMLAEHDLEGVRLLVERRVSFELCQSKLAEILEKALKAELIRRGWFLEKTHDLQRLALKLREFDPDFVDGIRTVVTALADVYFSARYPGFDLDPPNWEELSSQLHAVTGWMAEVRRRCDGLGR